MIDQVQAKHWDIFCRVVDNLGDIGVCWRLSRNLARRHGVNVRLWVDEPDALKCICPAVPDLPAHCDSVEILHWRDGFENVSVADCVIEAFACELPREYLVAMAQRRPEPVWINLEYLSAETWVEGCHGLVSPHPVLPLKKYFFFPGFTAATGGLLRETGLVSARQRFRSGPQQRPAFLSEIGVAPRSSQTRMASLFAYPQAPLATLLSCWSAMAEPWMLLVPQGNILEDIGRFFEKDAWGCGETHQCGALAVTAVPFLPQADYDRLLWCTDLNFVRGEDSFVRAQWAGSPFVWQIYRQDDDAHRDKLQAFMDLFCVELEEETASVLRRFWLAWNGFGSVRDSFEDFFARLPLLSVHAASWAEILSAQDDLATSLVKFYLSKVE